VKRGDSPFCAEPLHSLFDRKNKIEHLVDFCHVMELLALRGGQLLNQAELVRDAQLARSTAHRYINLLEASYLLAPACL